MNEFIQAASKLPTALTTVAMAIVALVVAKFFYVISNPRRRGPEGLMTKIFSSNNAVSIGITGYLFAIGVAINCGIPMKGAGQWSVETVAIGSCLAILLLGLSRIINDKILMYSLDNTAEIVNNNVAVAIVEAFGLASIGFILRGVLMSDSMSFYDKFIDVGAYWLIGQVLFAIGGIAYQLLTKTNLPTSPVNSTSVNNALKAGDNSVAISFGCFLVAYGMIIEASITGATSNIIGELPTIVVFSAVGLVLLGIVSLIVNTIFVESGTQNRLVGSALIAGVLLINIGFVFSGVTDSSITKETPPDDPAAAIVPIDAKLTTITPEPTPSTKPVTSSATSPAGTK